MNTSDIIAAEYMRTIEFLQARAANLAIELMALKQELEKLKAQSTEQVVRDIRA